MIAIVALLLAITSRIVTAEETPHHNISAIFAFGDSTFDSGNNNWRPTLVRANHEPYGCDFPNSEATGRFSDGLLITDFLVSSLGIKDLLPPYSHPSGLTLNDLTTGISFASAGSGLDNQTADSVRATTIDGQVAELRNYDRRVREFIGDVSADWLMRDAMFLVSAGSNDMINYYASDSTRKPEYNISAYHDFLLQSIESLIQKLYGMRGRKFMVLGLPPIGCLPYQMTKNSLNLGNSHFGERVYGKSQNDDAINYNTKLQALLMRLQSTLQGSKIAYIDIFNPLMEMVWNPRKHGFAIATEGCCGTGLIEMGLTCSSSSGSCDHPSDYVFWDAVHLSEAANKKLAKGIVDTISTLFSNPNFTVAASPSESPATSPSYAPTSPVTSPSSAQASPAASPTPSSGTSPTAPFSPTTPLPAPPSSPTISPAGPLSPSISPSFSPIRPPSFPPSSPTTLPSLSPTTSPNTSPTVSPSSPSNSPTASPSTSPSRSPAKPPSTSPSPTPSSALIASPYPSPSPLSSPIVPPSSPSPSPYASPITYPSPYASPIASPSPSSSHVVSPSSSLSSPTTSPSSPTAPPSPTMSPSSPSLSPSPLTSPIVPPSSPSFSPTPIVSPYSPPLTSPTVPPSSPSFSPTAPPSTSLTSPTMSPSPSSSPTSPLTSPTMSPSSSPSSLSSPLFSPIVSPTMSPSFPSSSSSPLISPIMSPSSPPSSSSPIVPPSSPSFSPIVPPSSSKSPSSSLTSPTVSPSSSPSCPSPLASPTVPPSSPSFSPTTPPSSSSASPTVSPSSSSSSPSSPLTSPIVSPTMSPSSPPSSLSSPLTSPIVSPSSSSSSSSPLTSPTPTVPPSSPSFSPTTPPSSSTPPTSSLTSPIMSPSALPSSLTSPTMSPSQSPSPSSPLTSPIVPPSTISLTSPSPSPSSPLTSPIVPPSSPLISPTISPSSPPSSSSPFTSPTTAPSSSSSSPIVSPSSPLASPTAPPSYVHPSSPTTSPTPSPSSLPSSPILAPTSSPTTTPTPSPSSLPSSPILAPTSSPTTTPVASPFASPSSSPSASPPSPFSPVVSPSPLPTHVTSPTLSPSCSPTVSPSSPTPPPVLAHHNITAVFAFGDSTVDSGKNNWLPTYLRANHPPYGRDFPNGVPTGRFSNGRLITDFLVSSLELKDLLPPYTFQTAFNLADNLTTGVSFASAGSGFDRATAMSAHVSGIDRQLADFRTYNNILQKIVGNQSNQVIKNAVFIVSAGFDDMLNYYAPFFSRKLDYDISGYQVLLLQSLQSLIKELYEVSARKFMITGLPPIGCTPLQITRGSISFGSGQFGKRVCVESQNNDSATYNTKLQALLTSMQSSLQEVKIVYADLYSPLMDMIQNPSKHGFTEATKGCCGTGLFETDQSCHWPAQSCSDPSKFVFWDSVHLSQAANEQLAKGIVDTVIPNLQ